MVVQEVVMVVVEVLVLGEDKEVVMVAEEVLLDILH